MIESKIQSFFANLISSIFGEESAFKKYILKIKYFSIDLCEN